MVDDIKAAEKKNDGKVYYCSFCGKHQDDVRKLIAGPGPSLFICDECVDLCSDICDPHGAAGEEAISAHETALRDVCQRFIDLESDVKKLVVRIEEIRRELTQVPPARRNKLVKEPPTHPLSP